MIEVYLHDFDNGLKYFKCGLYGLLNSMRDVSTKEIIGSFNINMIMCAAEICDDIDIYKNKVNSEIVLKWSDTMYSMKQEEGSVLITKLEK